MGDGRTSGAEGVGGCVLDTLCAPSAAAYYVAIRCTWISFPSPSNFCMYPDSKTPEAAQRTKLAATSIDSHHAFVLRPLHNVPETFLPLPPPPALLRSSPVFPPLRPAGGRRRQRGEQGDRARTPGPHPRSSPALHPRAGDPRPFPPCQVRRGGFAARALPRRRASAVALRLPHGGVAADWTTRVPATRPLCRSYASSRNGG